MSVFENLNAVNVNGHTEQKNGLTYLSWAWAWGELLKRYPDSTYTVYENKDGLFYHTDGRTCWVKTGVTVEGKEYIEMLPVMDFKNRSIPVDSVTSVDVNKAIQRSLTKAVARHGLGLYIYAGEDLPEGDEEPAKRLGLTKAESFSPAKAISGFCTENGISMKEFASMRSGLVAAKIVPDISSNDMTLDTWAQLEAALKTNFPDVLKGDDA